MSLYSANDTCIMCDGPNPGGPSVYCSHECQRKAMMAELASRKLRDTVFVDEFAGALMRLWSLHEYRASKLPKGPLRRARRGAASALRSVIERRSLLPSEERRKAA